MMSIFGMLSDSFQGIIDSKGTMDAAFEGRALGRVNQLSGTIIKPQFWKR